jgi:hypothetical protein
MQINGGGYKVIFLTLLSWGAILLFATGCMSQTRKSKPYKAASKEDRVLMIYIRRGTCLGRCPGYEASFFSDNTMEYNGLVHMPTIGRYSYVLPKDMIKNLLIEAKNRKIKTAADEYEGPPDAPTFEIKVLLDGKLKTIYSHGEAPEFVKDFMLLLHGEVKAMVAEQEGVPMPQGGSGK